MLIFGTDKKCAEKKRTIMEESSWEQSWCDTYKEHQGNVQKKEGKDRQKGVSVLLEKRISLSSNKTGKNSLRSFLGAPRGIKHASSLGNWKELISQHSLTATTGNKWEGP